MFGKFFWLMCIVVFNQQSSFGQERIRDTTIVYQDYNFKPIAKGSHTYAVISWPENSRWRQHVVNVKDFGLFQEGWFSDSTLRIKQGPWTLYHSNGVMADSCLFTNNKKQGLELGWDGDGVNNSIQHWHKGLPVDTAYWFNASGKPYAVQMTDSNGNGVYRKYADDGKVLRVNGRLLAGQKKGLWRYIDENGVLSFEGDFDADTLTNSRCYDLSGLLMPNKKDCMFEKTAEFKGGPEGWRRHLERNLDYPEVALRQGVDGLVRVAFMVNKDGKATDFKVVNSPHPSLAAEAVRIMKRATDWEPAVQYNRTVVYRLIQSITFQLQ